MKETKEHILFESFKLFLVNGYDKVSMNDLVRSSGLSKGAFYHYFSSKEVLFREAIETFFFTGLEERQFRPSKHDSLSQNLLNLIDFKSVLFNKLLGHTGLKALDSGYFTLIFQAIRMFPDFREKLVFAGSHEETMLEEIFSIAIKNNEVRNGLQTKSLSKIYSSMLDGMELHSVVEGDGEKLSQKQKEATLQLLKMISK
jgi:AcrR family transcriptional regulator